MYEIRGWATSLSRMESGERGPRNATQYRKLVQGIRVRKDHAEAEAGGGFPRVEETLLLAGKWGFYL